MRVPLAIVQLRAAVPFDSVNTTRLLERNGTIELDTDLRMIRAVPNAGGLKGKALWFPLENVSYYTEKTTIDAPAPVIAPPAPPKKPVDDTIRFVKNPKTGLVSELLASAKAE